ncbi:2-C-methyl-D-erythritol 4-phosphate cytidylyltransferase [bacterium]|nr:2-C-methyl-D-erythritol 4-phosphate cytidylyltransferase [bacterium]
MREKIMSKNYAIILASGSGSRYGNELPKQFVKIAGKTILEHTIEIFENAPEIDNICVVITPEYRYVAENILLKNNYKKVVSLLNGGETRKDSSFIGISSIVEEDANVIIHDCARPFLSQRIIKDCVEALKNYDAIDVAIPTADTIIEVDEKNTIKNIPVRANLRRGQTPQCFKLSVIKKAHELSKNDKNFTDDCGLIVKYNLCDVYVVEGEIENIKITYPSDIYMADRLFQLKSSIYPQEENLANIEGKTIVVFGGTSGIGKCVCDLASKYNAKVFGCGSSTGCDITSYDNVAEFLKDVYAKTGKIDYIINSAGVLRMGKLIDRDINDIQNDININYVGSINVAKAAIPYLKETKGCLLLYASSSYTRGRALYSTYSSTKAGIVNLTQALAEELAMDEIRVNVINPERTATPMRLKAFGAEQKGSLLEPEKVAEASIKTLLSDLTGQVIDVRREQ